MKIYNISIIIPGKEFRRNWNGLMMIISKQIEMIYGVQLALMQTIAASYSRSFKLSSQGNSAKQIWDSMGDLTIYGNGINIYWFQDLFGSISW